MIKLQIVGNLGKDCIMKEVNGRNVINFSVAHTERFKDAQGVLKEKTTWVECAYWTDKTGVAPYLTKGKTVYVEGTPDVESGVPDDPQVNEGDSKVTISFDPIDTRHLSSLPLVRGRLVKLLKASQNNMHSSTNLLVAIVCVIRLHSLVAVHILFIS